MTSPVTIPDGGSVFCDSEEVKTLALLLGALADPLDSVSLVGVLRGPLFGLSDPELFRFRQAGGRFELSAPLPEDKDSSQAAALDERYGPVLAAMQRLRGMWRLTRRLPLPAALEAILEETGWLALAATTPGGARAGHLLQAIERVREVVEDGGGLADAVDALNEEQESSESEALPLEPGRRNLDLTAVGVDITRSRPSGNCTRFWLKRSLRSLGPSWVKRSGTSGSTSR